MRARILTRWLLPLSLVGLCFATAASSASAHHPSVTEFQAGLSLNTGAWDLVSGDDGKLWLTEDRCSGTFARVTDGAVVVRDLTRRRSVVVRAGHSYLAPRGPHLARGRH